jgi:hypothetical protein
VTFVIETVLYIPKELKPGVLYVSKEYGTAAHLCACGCGSKVRTPLGETEWTVEDTPGGPTVWPSVGNWQKPCRSHYLIRKGEIVWCDDWSDEEVAAGRQFEEVKRRDYHDRLDWRSTGWLQFAKRWLSKKFNRGN